MDWNRTGWYWFVLRRLNNRLLGNVAVGINDRNVIFRDGGWIIILVGKIWLEGEGAVWR